MTVYHYYFYLSVINHPHEEAFQNQYTTVVLNFEREKNRSTRKKPLEAQERSTSGTLSHETRSPYVVSVVTDTTR